MSADNYLFVRKWKGRYYLTMEFASDETPVRGKPKSNAEGFDSVQEAMAVAFRRGQEEYFEYGVSVSPAVSADLSAAIAPAGPVVV